MLQWTKNKLSCCPDYETHNTNFDIQTRNIPKRLEVNRFLYIVVILCNSGAAIQAVSETIIQRVVTTDTKKGLHVGVDGKGSTEILAKSGT